MNTQVFCCHLLSVAGRIQRKLYKYYMLMVNLLCKAGITVGLIAVLTMSVMTELNLNCQFI